MRVRARGIRVACMNAWALVLQNVWKIPEPRPAAQGVTSENVAEKFGVDRAAQDAFAVASHARAAAAQATGAYTDEIVGVSVIVKAEDGSEKAGLVDKDDGVRAGTTLEALAKLKPAFKKGGTTTAGNSSQVSDGAAAVMVMKRSRAEALGLPALGVCRAYAVVGVAPSLMGIGACTSWRPPPLTGRNARGTHTGPAVAIPEAVRRAGITMADVDVFEINEAFASQAVYCVRHLGLDPARVNPLGGAIALGHPLGCTGARQIATLLHYMRKKGLRYGVVSMCIGTGMGAAAVFENIAL